jgi:DNA repair photolyase
VEEDWPILRRIEPGGPPPSMRLKVIKQAVSLGAPKLVRVQPAIPGLLGIEEPWRLVDAVHDAGASSIILEFLRAEPEIYRAILNLTGGNVKLVEYAIEARILHPSLPYRLRVASLFKEYSISKSLTFQTCKEGLLHLHTPTSMDCCGYALFGVRVARRPTLVDIYKVVSMKGSLNREKALSEACSHVEKEGLTPLCGSRLALLPRWLKRPLQLHERRLMRILGKRELLEHIVPVLTVDNDLIKTRSIGGPAGI